MRRWLAAALILSFTIFLPFFFSDATAQDRLESFEAHCCSIQFSDDSHLQTFTRRIGGFRLTRDGLDQNPANVMKRVDAIMLKVQSTLDMHPEIHITIRLYPDHDTISRAYRQFTVTGNAPLAFYAHRRKTIFVNVEGVTDGVLAHEMAHAVINFYFPVPPPAKMQEILAQYVDLHIWD